ncbi:Phosphotriesterase homology protein [Dyadobacter sp. CECT 9623]|uniref:Phosphotriesterase homology protein n=1 Tax=Dyadobacter linearis TaxID=2823330 RepID=A0ABN7R8W1_9BACT|nr:phosphotriesterase [Dyadobacter sp. CECT 9623]CAG5067923.1 Phosphotriesterase homology protein [Dyadobacter sp. CECT 9623]
MGAGAKNRISRRKFLKAATAAPLFLTDWNADNGFINSVNGRIKPADIGTTLIHEHVLVDFIGADKISPDRWKHEEVIKKVLPYLLEIKKRGIRSLVECTPAFLGRDVKLLQKLSDQSGLTIITNTGYYGASDNKYLPAWAFTESAETLAARWISEFENGIDGTDVRPGFIKTGVNSGPLSALHQKLITAAALTHLKTGLTICSHTGPALPADQEIEILRKMGVDPKAFVWVHANGTREEIANTAKNGCWVSLDGIGDDDKSVAANAELIIFLKNNGFLNQLLISHDAGWYTPGELDGGKFRGYTTISDKLIPYLQSKGFEEKDLNQLMVQNPAHAFTIKIRKL